MRVAFQKPINREAIANLRAYRAASPSEAEIGTAEEKIGGRAKATFSCFCGKIDSFRNGV